MRYTAWLWRSQKNAVFYAFLFAWRLHATQRTRITPAMRCRAARTRSRARDPRKIIFAGTADCASHKLICAKVRKQFSSADGRARMPTKEKIRDMAGADFTMRVPRTSMPGDDRHPDRSTAIHAVRYRFASAETTPAANAAGAGETGADGWRRSQ